MIKEDEVSKQTKDLLTTIATMKGTLVNLVANALVDGFNEPKDIKSLTETTLMIEKSLKSDTPDLETLMQKLVNKYKD